MSDLPTSAAANPFAWPASLSDEGALPELLAVHRWVTRHGLPELPPEHAALATQPFGIRLELRRVSDSPWREVFFSQHAAIGLGTWITWVEADGRAGQAFAPPGIAWALSGALYALMRRLRGDEIELRYALAGRVPLLPRGTWVHPDGWWDEWKSRQVELEEDAPTLGEVYRGVLYPRVVRFLDLIAAQGLPVDRVLDVCGGDGEAASVVLRRFPAATLTVIERNHVACIEARARLGPRHRVIEADAALPQGWEGLEAQDVALLIGAIQGNVMTSEEAVSVMRQVVAALRPGGFAVVAGWSPCLLDSRGFEELGLQVLNRSAPPTEEDPNPRQLYLLRRA